MPDAFTVGFVALVVLPLLYLGWRRFTWRRVVGSIRSVAGLPRIEHRAYLMDGSRRVAAVTVAGLVADGRLRVRPGGDLERVEPVTQAGGPPEPSALQWSVLDALGEPRPVRVVVAALRRDGAVRGVAAELAGFGLLVPPEWIRRVRRWTLVYYLLLLVAGVTLMLTGVRPAGGLFAVAVVVCAGVLLGGLPALPEPALTAGGETLRAELQQAPRPDELDAAIAVGGFIAYPDAEVRERLLLGNTDPS